jgi:hypothetical protein
MVCFCRGTRQQLKKGERMNTDWQEISGDFYAWQERKVPERPYIHDYSRTLTMKLALSIPDNAGGSRIFCTFDQVAEILPRLDAVTRGIPKILYLVGWQYKGHDDGYPAWFEVNQDLRGAEDAADPLAQIVIYPESIPENVLTSYSS